MVRSPGLLLFLPLLLWGQDQQKPLSHEEFQQTVARANDIFSQVWPGVIYTMRGQLEKSFGEMGDQDMVRKLRLAEVKLDQAPGFQVLPCPGGPADCQILRMSIPGDGKWSIKVAGEIVPPWQKNQQRFRKLRLTLKNLSLTQDFKVDLSGGESLAFEPMGPPKLTFRLTSPNLLYKAVLAAAQKFIKSSLEKALEDTFSEELPIARVALDDFRSLGLNQLTAALGKNLDRDTSETTDSYDQPPLLLIPETPPPRDRPPRRRVSENAFAVAFLDKDNIDIFAESFTAQVNVKAPRGRRVEDVTFKLGDREIAQLQAPPWRLEVKPEKNDQVLLATATLDDGTQEDDFLFIEGRGHIEELEVQYVNLYLSLPTRPFDDRQLLGLKPQDFQITENGVTQQVAKLEVTTNRQLALAVVMDASSSMEGRRMKEARKAAAQFVKTMIQPGDLMVLITFNNKVRATKLFDQKADMLREINNLKHMKGLSRMVDGVDKALDLLPTQSAMRCVLLVSDGFDYGSNLSLAGLKNRLHRDNVLVYSVGIDSRRATSPFGRGLKLMGGSRSAFLTHPPSYIHQRDLYEIATVSGGRAIIINNAASLGRAFSAVQDDMRKQVLLTYYSNLPSNQKGWRNIDVTYVHRDLPIFHKEKYWKD